jgi:hypothetical protein
MGENSDAYRILVGKPDEKRTLEKPKGSSEDDIKIDLREIEWGGMDWTDVA